MLSETASKGCHGLANLGIGNYRLLVLMAGVPCLHVQLGDVGRMPLNTSLSIGAWQILEHASFWTAQVNACRAKKHHLMLDRD